MPPTPSDLHPSATRRDLGLEPEQNPKDAAAFRDGKVKLDLLERVANAEIAKAMETGAVKYGKRNFRTIPINASIYAAAIKRHADDWCDGLDADPDSGLSPLAHIGANVHVLLAAIEAGTFVDDRGPATRTEIQEIQSKRSNEKAVQDATVSPATDSDHPWGKL